MSKNIIRNYNVEDSEFIIYAATYAVEKRLNFEQLCWSDLMSNKQHLQDVIWEYVCYCKDVGMIRFREEYKSFKMY